MDAMVFFAVALLICSIQLASLAQQEGREVRLADVTERCDPSAILQVFLKASLGTDLSVPVEGGLNVPALTPVSECLAAEAAALMKGVDVRAFAELNGLMLGIATNLSHPLLTVHIVMSQQAVDGPVEIVRIEDEPPHPGDIFAADCVFPESAGGEVIITLLLQPALLPEGFGI